MSTNQQTVTIKPPNFKIAEFRINGNAPLVQHRFSAKAKQEMIRAMESGKTESSKKKRDPKDLDQMYEEARYRSPEGWDGFHAASIRKACISACRLVNFKMTLAKMSIFVIADGHDAKEPQIPLIRIYGDPVRQDDTARLPNGSFYVTVRPAYHDWSAKVRIRWDADQFSLADITNLMTRVGYQVGIGEGRPDSRESCGCGWGTFDVEGSSK